MRNYVKRAVQRFTAGRGYDIVKRLSPLPGNALPLIDILIDHGVLSHGRRAILQIGANDGVLDDPVHGAIRRHGLAALLVEPLPDVFANLVKNYADLPGVKCVNVAVGRVAGEATLYRVWPGTEGLPDWTQGLASFNEAVLIKHASWPGVDRSKFLSAIEHVTVPVQPIRDLLSSHPDIVDYMMLQIDVEGYDLEILKSAAECDFLPQIICYEHKHLSHDDQIEARQLLLDQGYTFQSDYNDTVAIKDLG